jgi:hypothetical protein
MNALHTHYLTLDVKDNTYYTLTRPSTALEQSMMRQIVDTARNRTDVYTLILTDDRNDDGDIDVQRMVRRERARFSCTPNHDIIVHDFNHNKCVHEEKCPLFPLPPSHVLCPALTVPGATNPTPTNYEDHTGLTMLLNGYFGKAGHFQAVLSTRAPRGPSTSMSMRSSIQHNVIWVTKHLLDDVTFFIEEVEHN